MHTVVAKPLEDNLSEWHCNLTPDEGPYQGTAFHLVLQFPENYPNQPPSVRFCTYLKHPNVFGDWICLDMIKEPDYYARPYQGWSTAYSVQSVLLQLQSFLFAENVDQDYGDAITNKASFQAVARAKRDAAAFRCAGCGFQGSSSRVQEEREYYRDFRRGRTWERRPSARAPQRAANTVNDLIDQALARRARTAAAAPASDAASDAGSDAARVVPVEEHESPTRVIPSNAAPSSTADGDSVAVPVKPTAKPTAKPTSKPVSQPAKALQTPPKPARKIVLTPPTKARHETPQPSPDRLSALPTDVLVQIMDRLDPPALSALMRASKHFVRASTERGAWVRRELQCFHSKRGFAEEVLGFGLGTKGLEDEGRGRYLGGHYCGMPNCHVCGPLPRDERASKAGKGKWVGALSMDYLSAGAFFEGTVRRGVWNERLDWWLPLLLDDQHSARALPLLKGTISALAENPQRPPLSAAAVLSRKFNPLDTLKVLPRLMNGMVVSFMKQKETGAVDLHASEKALLGYCQLHHMLLHFAQEYPLIQTAIDRALSRFQTSMTARHKNESPDLGELLVLLSAAKTGGVTWASLAPSFLAETLDRNVLWLLKDHPELAYLEGSDGVSEYRLTKTFDASATSRRLIMFQVAFLLLVRPSGSSVSDTLAEYSQRYGYPRPGLTRKLQEIWYRVIKVATWPSYFSQLGLACPPKPALCEMLRQSVVSSRRKGYHLAERLRLGTNRALLAKRRQVEPTVRSGEDGTEGDRRMTVGGNSWWSGPVSTASGGVTAPPTSSRGANRASTKRDQRNATGPVAVVSENPFSVLATDDE